MNTPIPPPNLSASPDNAAAVAVLRNRRGRAAGLFYFFLLLIPLGCVIPCALFGYLPQGTPQTACAIAGLGLPFVGLGGMLLMLGDRSRYGRSLGLAEQADRMGFGFIEKPTEECAALQALQMFENADTHTALNLLSGKCLAGPALIVDYHVSFGTAKTGKAWRQTVIALDAATETVDFLAYPKGLLTPLSSMLGERLIDLPGQPEFNRHYALRANDADKIAAHFTPAVIDWMLAEKGNRYVEVRGGLLVTHRLNKLVAAKDYPILIEAAVRLAEAL